MLCCNHHLGILEAWKESVQSEAIARKAELMGNVDESTEPDQLAEAEQPDSLEDPCLSDIIEIIQEVELKHTDKASEVLKQTKSATANDYSRGYLNLRKRPRIELPLQGSAYKQFAAIQQQAQQIAL
jgi:hypothetical protein